MLGFDQRCRLVSIARAAASRAFLAAPGGTAYGAAVLTASGNIHQAGQYSSFNHVTNVHAEQAALLLATMADDADVLALAVASTAAEPVTRPCGVCRQVLAEHAARVGRDFEVLMACRYSDGHEAALVSELLPLGWSPGRETATGRDGDLWNSLPQPGRALHGEQLESGDHVTLSDGCIALVWDARFESDGTLVKLKYAPSNGGLRKVAHSFTEPLRYQKELHDLGWAHPARCGVRAAVIEAHHVATVYKALPLGAEVAEPPGTLMAILRDAGVELAGVRVTGSRALGLQRGDSGWDLIVPVAPNILPKVRNALATAIERGTLGMPPHSGTWRLIDRIFPGGREAALRGRRYTETILSDGASVALMFIPSQPQEVCVGPDWLAAGRITLYGTVLEDANSAYKRAEFDLQDDEGLVRVICYHKAANLVRAGDIISACGWLFRRGAERRLIQILPQPDRILWWSLSSSQVAGNHSL